MVTYGIYVNMIYARKIVYARILVFYLYNIEIAISNYHGINDEIVNALMPRYVDNS